MCARKKKRMKKLRIVVFIYTVDVMQLTLKLESHLKSLVNLSCLRRLQLKGHEVLSLTIEMQSEKVTKNIRNLYNTDMDKFQYWSGTQGNLLHGYLRLRQWNSAKTRGSCELLAVFWLSGLQNHQGHRKTILNADLERFHGKQLQPRNENKCLLTSKCNQTKNHLPWK